MQEKGVLGTKLIHIMLSPVSDDMIYIIAMNKENPIHNEGHIPHFKK